MRALVIVRNSSIPPIEMWPALAQGFVQWREQYRDKLEAFSFFASSDGGCAIANVADEAELYRILLEYPFSQFSDIQVHPLVDGDLGLQILTERIQALAGGQG